MPKLFGNEPDSERTDNKTIARLKRQAALEFQQQLTIGVPTSADEVGLRRLVRQLRSHQLAVKLFLRHPLHAKLYLAHRTDNFNPVIGFVGSSNLTMSGLRGQGELNVDVLEMDAGSKLVKWFEDRWNDARCLDITDDLIAVIEESWAGERLTADRPAGCTGIARHPDRRGRDPPGEGLQITVAHSPGWEGSPGRKVSPLHAVWRHGVLPAGIPLRRGSHAR